MKRYTFIAHAANGRAYKLYVTARTETHARDILRDRLNTLDLPALELLPPRQTPTTNL